MLSYRFRLRWFHALVFGLLTVVMLLSAITSQVRADSIYLIPDTEGSLMGALPIYAMTVNNGNPLLSYFSKNTNHLVIAICGNPACETDLTVIRPIEPIQLKSVAVSVVNGNPFVVYSPYGSNLLSVAACVDPLCSQPLVMTTLDNGFFGDIAITLQNGKALIAYASIDSPNPSIAKLAFCSNATCTAATIRPLNITQGINGASGLAVGLLNGNPIIAYTTYSVGSINLLKCLSSTCVETPSEMTVDVNANPLGIALIVAANKPIITYIVPENSRWWLKVATCMDSSCNAPMVIHTVDEAQGGTSVSLIKGLPVIAYSRDGIRIATCLDVACNYSSSTLIADSTHGLPVINTSYNAPIVSFVQNNQLTNSAIIKIYLGGAFQPSQSLTPSPIYTATATSISSPMPPLPSLTPTVTLTASITPTPISTATNTPTSPPNAPPQPNFYTTRTPTLTWNRVNWATGYQIQISLDINFPPAATFTGFVPSDTLSYTTGALMNGTYYWRVMAVAATPSLSKWSAVDTFVISAVDSP